LAIYKKSTADDYAQLLGATLDTYSHYLPSMGGDQTAKADRKGDGGHAVLRTHRPVKRACVSERSTFLSS
jgi:hypothetical protein